MNTRAIRQLLDEIDEKQQRLSEGSSAWQEGTDECAMAVCDPSDQFILGEGIEELWEQVRELVKVEP